MKFGVWTVDALNLTAVSECWPAEAKK